MSRGSAFVCCRYGRGIAGEEDRSAGEMDGENEGEEEC